MRTILTNCTVIDCTGRPTMQDMTVVIEGEGIKQLKQGTYDGQPMKGNVSSTWREAMSLRVCGTCTPTCAMSSPTLSCLEIKHLVKAGMTDVVEDVLWIAGGMENCMAESSTRRF